MSDTSERSWQDRLARARFWRWLAPGGNFVGVGCGLVGVVADRVSTTGRLAIVVVGLLIWIVASVGSWLVARAQKQDEIAVEELRARLASAGLDDRDLPDHALRMIAPLVFRSGTSWRLTLFLLEQDEGGWFIRPKIRCASTEIYESTARVRIPLDGSVLREITALELPASGELGDAPDREANGDEWQDWQMSFVRDEAVIRGLRMPTRKYAWCAARQPGLGGRTIALVAETVQQSGIRVDVLGSNLVPPILEMVLRLIDIPDAVNLDTPDPETAAALVRRPTSRPNSVRS